MDKQEMELRALKVERTKAKVERSREIRAWINMMKDSDQIIEQAAPKVLSELLDIPETKLLNK